MGVMRWQKEPSKSMEHLIPGNMLSSLFFSFYFLFTFLCLFIVFPLSFLCLFPLSFLCTFLFTFLMRLECYPVGMLFGNGFGLDYGVPS
jgi:hypothetical protein